MKRFLKSIFAIKTPFRQWSITQILAGQGVAGEVLYTVLDFIPGLRIHEVFRAVIRKHPGAQTFAEVMKAVGAKLDPNRTVFGLLGTVVFWYLFATGHITPEMFSRLTELLWEVLIKSVPETVGFVFFISVLHGQRFRVLPFYRPEGVPAPVIIGQGPPPDRYTEQHGEVLVEDVIGEIVQASQYVEYPKGASAGYRHKDYIAERLRSEENPTGRFELVDEEPETE